MKKLRVVYVPGLGDRRANGQAFLVGLWRLWGVRAEMVRMVWDDAEPWEAKQRRLLLKIDALIDSGYRVGLVGSSAGASAVINAFAARASKVAGCVLIAGKVLQPEAIGTMYRREAPAFVQSAFAADTSLAGLSAEDRTRILSRYSLRDPIVPAGDSIIPGACNKPVPTPGHAFTIGMQLLFGAPGFLGFLRRFANR